MRVRTTYEKRLIRGWQSMKRQWLYSARRTADLRQAIQQYLRGQISRQELEQLSEPQSGDLVTDIEMDEAGW